MDALFDLEEDKQDLLELGLSNEEIEGYEEFYFSEYFPMEKEIC